MQLCALTRRPSSKQQRLRRDNQSLRCHPQQHRAQERAYINTTCPTSSSTLEQPKD